MNLEGDEEDFSWYLKSVGKDDMLPKKKQDLSDLTEQDLKCWKQWKRLNCYE